MIQKSCFGLRDQATTKRIFFVQPLIMDENFAEFKGKHPVEAFYQPSIFDCVKHSEDRLTTTRVCELLKISTNELRQKCKIGKFLELDNYIVLHKGRNYWHILEI